MEIKNSLTAFRLDGEPVWVIQDHHTHADILRFVVDDIGLSEAMFILEEMKDKTDC